MAPDNPVVVLGQLEGLPPGHYRLVGGGRGCGEEGAVEEELEELLGSDGTTTYISSEEWGVTLHPTSSRLLLTKGSLAIVDNTTNNTVACTLVLSSSSPFLLLTQDTILILLVAATVLLLLLLAICLYCCCRR